MTRVLKNITFIAALIIATTITPKPQNVRLPVITTRVKEFYFVRHGQTDQNIGKVTNFLLNVPLNKTGIEQAHTLAPFIAQLPIKTICYSPLLRAKTTTDIIATHIPHALKINIPQLREMRVKTWTPLSELHTKKFNDLLPVMQKFVQRVAHGLKKALSKKEPVLIIAHGGVFKAICFLLKITPESWVIDNCELVRFYKDNHNVWHIQKLQTLRHPSAQN